MATYTVPDYGAGTIAAALAAATGGTDIVQLRAGTYNEGNLYVQCGELKAYPGDEGAVTINGSAVAADCLRVHAATEIHDLTLQGHASYQTIQLNAAGVHVHDNTFAGACSDAIEDNAGNGSHVIEDNVFSGSSAGGYAIDIASSAVGNTVRNNLVSGSYYRGIRPGAGVCYHNGVAGGADHAYYLDGAVAVRNCWAYSAGGAGFYLNNAGASVDYSLANSCAAPYSTGGGGGTWGANNLTVDPGFVGGGDYHPASATSATVDAGTNVSVSTDLDGNARPYGGGYDIGPYEYQGTPPEVTGARADGLSRVIVSFDQSMSEASLNDPDDWTLEPLLSGGATPVISGVSLPEPAKALLTLSSSMTSDNPYRVTAPAAAESLVGDVLNASADSADFLAPYSVEDTSTDLWGFLSLPTFDDSNARLPFVFQAVVVALLADARAESGDGDPLGDGNPRGFWGDYFRRAGESVTGSRLWTAYNRRVTSDSLSRYRDLMRESLKRLVDAGLVTSAEAEAVIEQVAPNVRRLRLVVETLRDASAGDNFADLWEVLRADV